MNITTYVEKIGNLSFEEKSFCDTDALIFTEISYLFLHMFVPSIHEEKESFLIKDIPLSAVKGLTVNTLLPNKNTRLIKAMIKSKRYQDVGLADEWEIFDKENDNQFYAVTFILPDKTRFIAYRGTDITLTGWQEDFDMAYMDKVPAQKEALEYLKEECSKFSDPFYIGGHSKGGNMAAFAAIYMPESLNNRLIKAYSFDGPGFKNSDIFSSSRYRTVQDRFFKAIPHDDLIGVLLHNSPDAKIIDASSFSILQHDPFVWKLDEDGNFIFLEKRTDSSLKSEELITRWLASLSHEETVILSKCLIELLGGKNATVHMIEKKILLVLPQALIVFSKYDKKTQDFLVDAFKKLLGFFKDISKENKKKRLPVKKKKLEAVSD